MVNIIKPSGVLDIDFSLNFIDKDEYYMSITYIVPDSSDYLQGSKIRHSDLDFIRYKWNQSVKNSIKDYFNTNLIITQSGLMSKSYHDKIKK